MKIGLVKSLFASAKIARAATMRQKKRKEEVCG